MLVAHYEIRLAPGWSAPLGEVELNPALSLRYDRLVVHSQYLWVELAVSPKGMPLVFRRRDPAGASSSPGRSHKDTVA